MWSRYDQSDNPDTRLEELSQAFCVALLLSIGLGDNAEIFLVLRARIMPATGGRNSLVDLTRTPHAFLVFVDRSTGIQYRINDSPASST